MKKTNKKTKSSEKQFHHSLRIHRTYEVVQRSVETLILDAKALEMLAATWDNASTGIYKIWFESIQPRPNIKLIRMDLFIMPSTDSKITLAFTKFTYSLTSKNVKYRFYFFLFEEFFLREIVVRQFNILKRRIEVWI